MWRNKSKDLATAICGCDIDLVGNGQFLVIVGFLSGAIEVREHLSGKVIYQTKVEESGGISNLFYYDYRMSGQPQVVIVTLNGIIQGYNMTKNIK